MTAYPLVVDASQVTSLHSSRGETEYRNYVNSVLLERVSNNYKLNHTFQTYEFVQQKREEFFKFDKAKMSIWEAAELLNNVVDESDPDSDSPQIMHLLQTAEALRKIYPSQEYRWLHLTGFIHDLGKIIALPQFGSQPQWAVVGDTFPTGCKHSEKIVFPQFFELNPDASDPRYNTELGVYTKNCGLDNVLMSWGHDEYLYQVCIKNGCKLPAEGLAIIRYHSFYSWHSGGEYSHLTNDHDEAMLKWIKLFQKCDLYSKSDEALPDVEKLKSYYQGLIEEFFPPVLSW